MELISKRSRIFALTIFGLALFALSISTSEASAGWHAIDSLKIVTSMDFLPTGVGLVGIGGPGPRIERWDGKGGEAGTYVANSGDVITSLKVVDSTTAWATITNEGLYETKTRLWGLNSWSQVLGGSNLRLLYATKTILFIIDGKTLKFSNDLATFTAAHGILASDTVNAIDRGDGPVYIATTATHVYRSVDGGGNWLLMDSVVSAQSVFYDSVAKAFFIGGDTVRRSLDFGVTWVPMVSPVSDVSGQVVGVHDCSGTFYVTTYISNFASQEHNTILRSQDHGATFQSVGRAHNSTIHFQQGLAFDRGTQFYWLDPADGWLSLSTNGVDGSIPPQVAPQLFIVPDSSIVSNECEHQVTPFNVALNYLECVAVHVDSIKILSSIGTVSLVSYNVNVSNSSPAVVHLNYEARSAGADTIHFRLWFHNTESAFVESKDFTCIATGISDPAKFSASITSLDFGQVKVDSAKSLYIVLRNTGCDELRLDSLQSSNPTLFSLDSHTYPLLLRNGDSVRIKVTFSPVVPGEQIEAIEYGSSAGHGFIKIRGTGTTTVVQGVETLPAGGTVVLYPNPTRGILTVNSSRGISEIQVIDALGRTVLNRPVESGGMNMQIDMRPFRSGAYFIRVNRNRPIPFLLIQ